MSVWAGSHETDGDHLQGLLRLSVPVSSAFKRIAVDESTAAVTSAAGLELLNDVPVGKLPNRDVGSWLARMFGSWRGCPQRHGVSIEERAKLLDEPRLLDRRNPGGVVAPVVEAGDNHRGVGEIDHAPGPERGDELAATKLRLGHRRFPTDVSPSEGHSVRRRASSGWP